ncbi:MAG: hypothetical protein MUF58_08090 [Arcicella sp.]|nr:hypothetical protein [Arcicella sp.]
MKKDYTNQTLTKGLFAVRCLLLIFQALSFQTGKSLRAFFYHQRPKLPHVFTCILLCVIISFISTPTNAQVSGTVFRDYNGNGTKETYELGVSGISVRAYNNAGTVFGPVLTNTTGAYTISGVSGKVRVEFSIPNTVGCFNEKMESGYVSGGSSVQFVTAPINNVNFSIHAPAEYSIDNPTFLTTCFVGGSILLDNSVKYNGIQIGVKDMDAVVSSKYDNTKKVTDATLGVSRPTNSPPVTPNNTYLASAKQVGAVWGVAYQRQTDKAFVSAIMKRSCQFGPLGTGGIYMFNNASSSGFNLSASVGFIDVKTIGINTGDDTHPLTSLSDPQSSDTTAVFNQLVFCDGNSFDAVGKVGIGDIDISDDGKYMYLTNLNDRTLYRLEIGVPAVVPSAAKVTKYASAPWLLNPPCVGGLARPWGVKFHKGKIYVGVVCTGETSKSKADIKAMVYEMDANSGVWVTTPVLNIPLNYVKGKAGNSVQVGVSDLGKSWNPWINFMTDNGSSDGGYAWPSAILSDIEFDTDGSMIIGLMDRMGHQLGAGQAYIIQNGQCVQDPARSNGPALNARAGGDILRAGKVGTCLWQLENNANDGKVTSLGVGNGQGIGGGEFYVGDYLGTSITAGNHQETFVGGLALQPGTNQVLGTSYDPFGFVSGGVNFFDNTTGNAIDRYEVFPPLGRPYLGKANGIGDIELLNPPAPIEIGNRVWKDIDKDGIQDPSESPLVGVTIVLYDSNNVAVDTTTTDANGNYSFSSLTDPDVLPNTTYKIKIVNLGTNISVKGLSLLDVTIAPNETSGINTGLTLANNDAFVQNGLPTINITTGDYGQNNHTYDFGLICTPVITVTPKSQIICGSKPVAYTRKIVSGAVSSQQWYGPLADTTSTLGTAIAGAVDSTFTPSTLPALGQTRYYAVIARNGDALCSDTAFVILKVAPKLSMNATSTNPLCSTGGGSLVATVNTGTAPYSYLWSSGATTSAINNVVAGAYTVTVTDANGCKADTTLTITKPDSLDLSMNVTNITCNAGTNGALMSSLTGGKSPYTYEWYNGTSTSGLFFSNNPSVTGLSAGSYTLKVVDANGCFKVQTVNVTQPIAFNIAQGKKNNICFDQSKGEIYVSIGGGTPPVNIKWNVDGNYVPAYDGKDTLRNLKAGIYELLLTDANGCTTSMKDTLVHPDSLSITFTKKNGTCSTGNKGNITTTVTGGVAPYSYAWSNGESTKDVTDLISGNYKLVVTDAKGCKDSITVFIDEQDCLVDVALKKTALGNCERKVGDAVTFRVVVSRQDTTSQTVQVLVKDNISSDLQIVSSSATKGSFDASSGEWSLINLAKGDSAVLLVNTTVKTGAIGLVCNQALVQFMSQQDIDSQPANTNPVEDDIAYACITVPIKLCKADSPLGVTLTTPDSLTNIKWFKNGVEITSEAGKDSITVNDAGSYTFTGTSNGTDCQVGNCCPVIIEDACYGSIGDYVFDDNNKDGIQNAGDTPIGGIKVYLLDGTTGAKLDSTITDANGKYLFDSLLSNTYRVQFGAPNGKTFTKANAGNNSASDSDANTSGLSNLITIDTTKPSTDTLRNNPQIDAGLVPIYGSIGDYVWIDQNNDGQQSVGELPLAGVKVYLYDGTDNTKLDSTVTDANGKYLFDSLLTGSYKVQFVAPAGTIPAKQNVGADQTDSDANTLGFSQIINIDTTKPASDTLRNNPQIDAGFVPVGSIGDYVFNDKNGNGTQESTDTPIAGIKVYLLDGAGAKLDSTVTDATGKYLFDSLLAGNYKVSFVIPAGSEATVKGAGTQSRRHNGCGDDRHHATIRRPSQR